MAPRPTIRAVRATTPVVIDGVLDEPSWQLADSTTGFTLNLPRVGYPASESTVVRVLYDEKRLYIGATMYDSEPDRLTISGLEQDFQTHDSDIFGFSIDTYWDKQNALFAVNPAGAIFDAQVFNDSRYVNRAWEGVIFRKTTINDHGWTAEIAIPFTTLRFNRAAEEQTWGVNFLRRVRRRNEDGYWAPIDRQYRVHKMSQAGTLTGLQHLQQGRNLTIKPYVSAARQVGELRIDDHGNDFNGGFDLKYGVTPRLTLDITAFTDFSQVEVDQEQVNLTRFPLFFPEKRDFFMENAGIFAFGDVTEPNYRTGSSPRNFTLFHSRRIGLSEDRRPVPILLGARLSGRTNGFELGILNTQTQESRGIPSENFAVARIRRSIFGSGDVGLMFINRQVTESNASETYNRSYGIDANLRLLGHMIVNSYLAATDQPNQSGNSKAAWLQVAWRDPIWDASAVVKQVGGAFDPGVGFVRRRAIRQAFATLGAHPQPDVSQIVEVNPYIEVSLISDLHWDLDTRTVTAGLGTTFIDGSMLTFEYNNNMERLTDPETITGVELPPGEYAFADASLSYTSSGARSVSGGVRLSRGGFFDGDITSIRGNALLRPNYHVSLDFTVEHNDLTLADSSLSADLFSARIRYALSTSFFASAFVQYNSSADEVITNVRFNLIHAPLSDVFLVYSERRNTRTNTLLDRVLTAKMTKLFAF
ncbi:MAG: DUF5916 domain-containing protein [Gemmatimonadales bacterium]